MNLMNRINVLFSGKAIKFELMSLTFAKIHFYKKSIITCQPRVLLQFIKSAGKQPMVFKFKVFCLGYCAGVKQWKN